jgi:hypothetical protein
MPATEASIGYGSTFAVESDTTPGTYVDLAEVYDITPPDSKIDLIDATHSQSPNRFREFIQGLVDPGETSFEMNFVPGSAADTRIQELRDGVTRSCKITFPNGATWTFDAILTGYAPKAPTADKMTASVTFKVSGSVVAAAAP